LADVVRETHAMLRDMNPVLDPQTFVFCTATDPVLIARAQTTALGCLREDEGVSLILEQASARAHGLDASLPMRRIVLEVLSALDGVGLTAAVATALADAKIPCNVVAAFHHDHIFVPAAAADRALAILRDLQGSAVTPPAPSGTPRPSA
jgi:uncharacterized protein